MSALRPRMQRAVLWAASQPSVIAVSSRTQHHADRLVLRLSGNRTTLSAWLAGVPIVMLTTTGAKSGQPRTLPLLCITAATQPDQFAIIGTNWGQPNRPGWYFNLRRNPEASGVINGVTAIYRAHEAMGDEYAFWWQAAVKIYPAYELYKQRVGDRPIPIMVLAPTNTESVFPAAAPTPHKQEAAP